MSVEMTGIEQNAVFEVAEKYEQKSFTGWKLRSGIVRMRQRLKAIR